jgi:hypothetical protein
MATGLPVRRFGAPDREGHVTMVADSLSGTSKVCC